MNRGFALIIFATLAACASKPTDQPKVREPAAAPPTQATKTTNGDCQSGLSRVVPR